MKNQLIKCITRMSMSGVVLALLLTACTSGTPTLTQIAPITPLASNTPQVDQVGPSATTVLPTKVASTLPAPTAAATLAASATPETMTVKIVMIAVGDNGASGKKIGCGDSAVPVLVKVPHTTGVLKASMERLLDMNDEFYGQSGLYNALFRSDLKLDSATLQDGKAVIRITGTMKLGGECDTPRVEAQLKETALQFSSVKELQILINGQPLENALSLK